MRRFEEFMISAVGAQYNEEGKLELFMPELPEVETIARGLDRKLKGDVIALSSAKNGSARTPYKSPQANSFCERLIGTVRREGLDFMIPINEAHIRQTLKSWKVHYNFGRPHSSLGP